MGLIEWYILFAVATAIFMHIEFFVPVLNNIEGFIPTPVVVEYRKLFYVTTFCISMLMAPLLSIPAIFFSERFKRSLENELRRND